MPRPRLTPAWLVGLALLALSVPSALAQVAPAPTGTSWEVLSAPEARVAPALPGEVERFRVAFDEAPLVTGAVQRGDELRVELPAGARTFAVARVDEHLPGTRSVAAVSTSGAGEFAAFTYTAAGVVGLLSDGDDLYQVLPGRDGQAVLARMDPAAMDQLACGNDDHVHPPGQAGRVLLEHAASHPTLPGMAEGVDDPITIDLLLLYTAAAEAWASSSEFGSIDAVIAQSLNLTQAAFENSQVGLRIRLVHAQRVTYNESTPPPDGASGGPSAWHLYRLTATPEFNPWGAGAANYLLEAHALRDQYGADLVTLFAEVSDVGGIAWLLNTIAGRQDLGFSVNRVQQMASGFTLAHEIGHNLGNDHGREQPNNAAGPAGGIFPYSAGWRWTDSEGQGFNTVMSYGIGGDIRIPHFSNPDVSYLGHPTGTVTGAFGPADAARSMRETKRIVASYRPTRVTPPRAGADAAITLETFRNETATRALTITNTGASDLVWEVDLVAAATLPAARATSTEGEVLVLAAPTGLGEAPAAEGAPQVAPGNLSPGELSLTGDLITIYSTFFSAQQGFPVGASFQRQGWTSQTGTAFEVSTANPSRGNRHLRVVPSGTGSATVYSPYFGAWPTGRYDFSMDVAISARHESAYFLQLVGERAGILGGFAFGGTGSVLAYNPQQGNYTNVGRTWAEGTYARYTVIVDPEARLVRYLVDSEEVAARPLPATARGIGRLQISRNPGVGTDHLDLDDLSYRAFYLGLEWVRPDRHAGVTPPGGQSTVTLTFPSEEVEPGTYAADLVIRSNDPASPQLRVPLSLTVSGQVSAEDELLADRTRLLGSHPNPTSGAARIGYVLARPTHVTLEVFSVTGQRVAVLADAYQPQGTYDVALDTSGLAGGVYVYRLRAGDTVEAGRLTVLR